ncbi:hypothetical protein BSKO_10281 [Bryopsis sp. KO-2023]|nr:hypothetical protein BSKO_10281 [Bryopsis sp. KO-2023]
MSPKRSRRSREEDTSGFTSATDIETPLRTSGRPSATFPSQPPASNVAESPLPTPQPVALHAFVTFDNPLFGKRCDWEDESVAKPVSNKKSWMLVGGRKSPRLAASRAKQAEDSKRKFLALTRALEGRRVSDRNQESHHTKRRRMSSVV